MISEASVAQAILDFWFSAACRPKWFAKDAAFDADAITAGTAALFVAIQHAWDQRDDRARTQ